MKVTTDRLEAVRQPEYTGNNRCLPCTCFNSAIAVVLSVTVGSLTASLVSVTLAVPVGGTVLGLSAATIYLRGYLVPGTPELTKQYLPVWLLEKFGKAPDFRSDPITQDLDADPIEALIASGALRECPDVDDLCLTETFRRRWLDRFDEVMARANPEAVIAAHFGVDEDALVMWGYDPPVEFDIDEEDLLGAIKEAMDEDGAELPDIDPEDFEVADDTTTPSDVEVESVGDDEELTPTYTIQLQDGPMAQWPSRDALFAEIAAAEVLEQEWDWEQWGELDAFTQNHLLDGLRLFLDNCPACGSDLIRSEEIVESCCAQEEVVAVICEECESRLHESEL